jgi:hypothetical protein
MIAQSEEVK